MSRETKREETFQKFRHGSSISGGRFFSTEKFTKDIISPVKAPMFLTKKIVLDTTKTPRCGPALGSLKWAVKNQPHSSPLRGSV